MLVNWQSNQLSLFEAWWGEDARVEGLIVSVFELLEKGELLEVPTDKPLTEDEAWRSFRDVISGLEYCESKTTNYSTI